MKQVRSVTALVTSRVSVLAGAAAAAMVLASIAGASPLGQSGAVAFAPRCDNCGVADLQLTGTVDPTQGGVGDTLTWQLTVNDYNTGPALDVWVDVTLPSNVQLVSSYTDRGTGCTSTGATTLHCYLDWLADTAQFGHVILVTTITATGDHTMTAITGYSSPSGPVADPTPANNSATVTAATPTPPPPPTPPSTIVVPVIGSPAIAPGPLAGKHVTVSFHVTQGDTGAPVTAGRTTWQVSLFGNTARYRGQVVNGLAQLSLTLPKTAKGKQLKVGVTVLTADGGSASRVATFRVH
jgi:hypothetical protein